MRRFYVYIMASPSRTLYVGVTNSLARRVFEHQSKPPGAFCTRYNISRLVYVEEVDGPNAAIEREKQIKSWRQSRKIELVESFNPRWEDLSEGWVADTPDGSLRGAGDEASEIPRLRRLRSE